MGLISGPARPGAGQDAVCRWPKTRPGPTRRCLWSLTDYAIPLPPSRWRQICRVYNTGL